MLTITLHKKKDATTESILATWTVNASEATEDPAVFVVRKIKAGVVTDEQIVQFLSIASTADYNTYNFAEIYPGIYRTNRLTLTVDSAEKYDALTANILADIEKSYVLESIPWCQTTYTFEDTESTSGPFFFGSVFILPSSSSSSSSVS